MSDTETYTDLELESQNENEIKDDSSKSNIISVIINVKILIIK